MATKTKYVAPTANFWSTTLNGAINDSVDTFTLNSTTNLQAPGYLVIDREDGSGTATPSSREVIYYTGISSNDLTGVTRGADGSTARSHSDGALVEATMTVGMWNSLATVVDQVITDDGVVKSIISPVSVARLELKYGEFDQIAVASIASITDLQVGGNVDISSASVTGMPLTPVFAFTGSLSGPTTLVQTPLPMPRAGQWSYVNVITRTVASTTSLFIDINKNGTSIFDSGLTPTIAAGGTFVSSASIKTKGFNKGDRISWDCDMESAADGHITDFDVILRSD